MLLAPSRHLDEGRSWGLRMGIREQKKKRCIDVKSWNSVSGRAQSHKPQAQSHKPQATSHKPQTTSQKPLVKAIAQSYGQGHGAVLKAGLRVAWALLLEAGT